MSKDMSELKIELSEKNTELTEIINSNGMNSRDKAQLENFIDRFVREPSDTGYIKNYEVVLQYDENTDDPTEKMSIKDFIELSISQNVKELTPEEKETVKILKTEIRIIKGSIIDVAMRE